MKKLPSVIILKNVTFNAPAEKEVTPFRRIQCILIFSLLANTYFLASAMTGVKIPYQIVMAETN